MKLQWSLEQLDWSLELLFGGGGVGLEPGADPPMLQKLKGPFLQIISITRLRRSVVTRVFWKFLTSQLFAETEHLSR